MKRRKVQVGVGDGRAGVSANFDSPSNPEELRSFEESHQEHAGLLLAQAAIDGLEDLGAGRVLDEAELDRDLSTVPAKRRSQRSK